MAEETQKPAIAPHYESRVMGVSVRGILAFMLAYTVCLCATMLIEVKEPLYTLSTVAVGFYFGSNKKP